MPNPEKIEASPAEETRRVGDDEIDESGIVLTPNEIQEREEHKREDPNWWREQR